MEQYGIEIMKTYGIWGVILSGVFYTLIKTNIIKTVYNFLSKKFVEDFMKDVDTQSLSKFIKEEDIINHDIFNYIDLWRFSRIPAMQFNTEYRSVVFKKYLCIFLTSYKSNITTLLEKGDYKTMGDSEILKTFLDLINRVIYDYEREMTICKIPKLIIDKMKVRNNETIDLIIDLIQGICTSSFYSSDNNYLKVYSILNIILSVSENTIQNSEQVCDGINGSLSGFTFNDGTIIITEPDSRH